MPQGPQWQHLTEKHKAFSKLQNNCGTFLGTPFCTVQQKHITLRVYRPEFTSHFYQPTDWGRTKLPTLRIHVICIWKMKGSGPRLHHYPGCFPLDIFQFANVHKIWPPKLKMPFQKWPDQHKRFITCVDPALAFLKIKLFSLNVKQVQNIKNYQGTLVYPQAILQRKTKLLTPLKLLLILLYPLPHPPLTGNNAPKFCVYTCLLKNSLITCSCIPKQYTI